MARLNEPASAESVESLKRRFVRQNREIARANSIQSVRIRTLEADVARLLAENVSLREEVISVNQELEKYQGSERIDNGIDSIKAKLEAKLAEVSGLVGDLGNLRRSCPTTVSSQSFQGNTDTAAAPTEFEGMPNARTFRDMSVGGLPVILEDKCYPRLSLGSDGDINPTDDQGYGHGMQDPVVNSQIQEPPNPSPQENILPLYDPDDNDTESVHIPDSPPSLDMRKRRRRRDSSLLRDIIPESDDPLQDNPGPSPHVPKIGFKRKFNASEEEEHVAPDCGSDDFQFTRVTGRPNRRLRDTGLGNENLPPEISLKKSSQTIRKEKPKTVRRVLGPKSANVDLKSPTKKRATEGKPSTTTREASEKPKRIPKAALSESFPHLGHDEPKVADIHTTEEPYNQPERHNAMFSDETDQRAREFPPNPTNILEIETLTSDQNESTRARSSRRSRGSVSYAEPNLRDKMRRPTKQLVDAVAGEKYRRISKAYPVNGTSENPEAYTYGPTHYEGAGHGTDASKEQETNLPQQDSTGAAATENGEQSASKLVISTLVAGTKKRSQAKRPSVIKPDTNTEQALTDSLEEDDSTNAIQNTSRQSRRHSTKPSRIQVDALAFEELMNEGQEDLEFNTAQVADDGRRAQRHSTRRRTTMV